MSLQKRLMARLLEWSYGHPRARIVLREGWGLTREVSRRLHVTGPFEPAEFAGLRRLAATVPEVEPSAHRILFLSMRGWSTHLAIETTLAHAVRLRGAEPVFVTCGGRLPICDVAPIHAAPPMPCHSCSSYATGAIEAAGFTPQTLTSFIDVARLRAEARQRLNRLPDLASCEAFEETGQPLGQWVRTSVLWFLSRGTLNDDAETVRVYRLFLVSAVVLRQAFTAVLDKLQPKSVFLLNGSFFAERILCELATLRGTPCVRYEKGFMTDTILLGPWARGSDDLDPGAQAWQDARAIPLDAAEVSEIEGYLDERVSGGRTHDNLWRQREVDVAAIEASLQLEPGRPKVTLFSNILWDSAIQDKDVAFPSMTHWLLEAIRWASTQRQIDLVVRIHPAEVRLANHVTRERMLDLISSAIPELPDNVRVVPPESIISSYALMRSSSIGLVYTSTIGLELATQGIPAVVAASTHFGMRGFTWDPPDAQAYWKTTERLLTDPPSEYERHHLRSLALRYAHMFFFRFHQPLRAVHEKARSRPTIVASTATAIAPGADSDLDRIADGIIATVRPVVAPITGH